MEEIKDYLSRVEGYLKSNDYLLKQILTAQTQILARLEVIEKSNTTPVAPQIQISAGSPALTAKRKPKPEETESALVEKVKEAISVEEKDPKFFKVGAPKYSVSQRILTDKGSKIYLADVTLEQNGIVIEKVRTASSGIWMAVVPAGKYLITISKNDPQNLIDLKYELEVPDHAFVAPDVNITPKSKISKK